MVSTRGGGHKKKYRWVDTVRTGPEEGAPLVERVVAIKYDPCRTARIALVAQGTSVRYIIATTSMKEGDLISSSSHIPRIASTIFTFCFFGSSKGFFSLQLSNLCVMVPIRLIFFQ